VLVTAAASFRGGAALRGAAPIAAAWACASGALVFDDVYDGCTWDARAETVGWDAPGYAPAAGWPAAVLAADPGGAAGPTKMTAQTMPPVSVVALLPARTVNEVSPGVFVLDFGQNFAGYVRLTLPAPVPAGLNITLRHAEVLQHPPYGPQDGSIYVGNLRSARATDAYTTRASPDDDVVFEPMFTYHGCVAAVIARRGRRARGRRSAATAPRPPCPRAQVPLRGGQRLAAARDHRHGDRPVLPLGRRRRGRAGVSRGRHRARQRQRAQPAAARHLLGRGLQPNVSS
jgi:hypothetical protein